MIKTHSAVHFALFFGALALLLLVASQYVSKKQNEYKTHLETQVEEQVVLLKDLAQLVSRNQSDAIVDSYIQDCRVSNRARFDTLLDNLATLDSTKLTELRNLYGSCAGYFANKKTAMVTRLAREYAMYSDLVENLSIFDGAAASKHGVVEWKKLIGLEQQNASLLAERVLIQEEIIIFLQDGLAINSSEIKEKLILAEEITQSGSVISRQIDSLRTEIDTL